MFNNYKINNLQKHNSAVRIYYSLQIMRESIFFFEDLCDLRNILKSPIFPISWLAHNSRLQEN